MTVTIDKVKVNGETTFYVSCPDVVRYPLSFHTKVEALLFVNSLFE